MALVKYRVLTEHRIAYIECENSVSAMAKAVNAIGINPFDVQVIEPVDAS